VSAIEPRLLAVTGALTVATAAAQWQRLGAQIDADHDIDGLDLSAVGDIDSAGLALRQALRRRARRPLALRGAPAHLEPLCIAHRVVLDRH
jgi:ABC-type transporter Mla MlaB component